jgi:hypothetical protein
MAFDALDGVAPRTALSCPLAIDRASREQSDGYDRQSGIKWRLALAPGFREASRRGQVAEGLRSPRRAEAAASHRPGAAARKQRGKEMMEALSTDTSPQPK